MAHDGVQLAVERLTMAYGDRVIQRDLDFGIARGSRFVIMGGSGCGKSTLLKHMIGLLRPASGSVVFDGRDLWSLDDDERVALAQRFGVLYQSGALWSSMTVAENVALPLEQHTALSRREIDELVRLKLALVGLAGFEDLAPSELSGGMRKRAGLARAMALDPEILFLDEPSAGLDPPTSRLLDDLILELNESLGVTFVVVTHELESIFAIGTDSVFLDPETRTMIDRGPPRELATSSAQRKVRDFLARSAGPARAEREVTA
jgi:phospholipid/cholesterol/gamma-HCH transport system ATP-binding protein